MTGDSGLLRLSRMDEDRFGVRTAKSLIEDAEDVPEILRQCGRLQVGFLIARCPTGCLGAVQEMERQGFLLMDTLLYFSYDLTRGRIPDDLSGNVIRLARPGDELSVREIAGECFRGYLGHYHADERLDRDRCDGVYADWAYRTCLSTDTRDSVLVAMSEGRIVGFGTLHAENGSKCEGGLFGVAPSFQRMGIYRSIMIGCLNWCAGRGMERVAISTQVTNLASQKAWTRLGFEPDHSFYTFHRWFDELGKDRA